MKNMSVRLSGFPSVCLSDIVWHLPLRLPLPLPLALTLPLSLAVALFCAAQLVVPICVC